MEVENLKATCKSNEYMHVQSRGHTLDLNNANIPLIVNARSKNFKIRRELEGIHMLKTSNTINRTFEVHPHYHKII